jgi:3-oxoacyl-[acyl-carrier-protein] synthase II
VTVSALSLKNGFMTPTINMETPDPECDMDYIANVGREGKLKVAVSNCISFGSKNSALVLKIFE